MCMCMPHTLLVLFCPLNLHFPPSTPPLNTPFLLSTTASNSQSHSLFHIHPHLCNVMASSGQPLSTQEMMNPADLFDMRSLESSFPPKRGLSRFYSGKARSFTCMVDVKCVEDLKKPEPSIRKRKKCSSKYGSSLLLPPLSCWKDMKSAPYGFRIGV